MQKNYKDFSLEKALAGEPVVTRNGRKVQQLHLFDAKSTQYPIHGVSEGYVWAWTRKGTVYTLEREDPMDLFMLPREVTYWVNVYRSPGSLTVSNIFESEDHALTYEDDCSYVKTISFTINE